MFSSNTSQVSADANWIEECFSTTLYTGNSSGSSTQTITNGIDLSTKGGMVWLKDRANTGQGVNHYLYDTLRGANNQISSNLTSAQSTVANKLTAFNASGFDIGTSGQTNFSGTPYVSWTFRKQPKFFDVVTYTGDGQNDRQISHSLGSTPGCIIVKCLNFTGGGGPQNWSVYHRSISPSQSLFLNTTAAAAANDGLFGTATSTYFVVNQPGGGNTLNANGDQYVAYLFAHDAGGFGLTGTDNVISCGSYTGTGAAGNAITLGYEPQWVLIKRTDSTGNWGMTDTMRGMSVTNNAVLYSNLSNAELDAGSPIVYPTATGFTCGTGSAGWNASGGTYIYIAIRRGPMKTPTTGTSVFSPTTATSEPSTTPLLTGGGFASDMVLHRPRYTLTDYGFYNTSRLTGGGTNALETFSTSAEYSFGPNYWKYDNSTAAYIPASGYFNNNGEGNIGYALYSFRRAPGFFDVVCYTGTGIATTFNHNLGVVPELMIIKSRSPGVGWSVYSADVGNTKFAYLNQTTAFQTNSTAWNNTSPTASVFTVGTGQLMNFSGYTYVAYLFATVAGVSKVGSYTGSGTTKQIDCGFTGGARFVLIKRTDSTGDWYVWDSARGIVAGNDPYLLLNSTAAEVTNTDYIDTYSAGFEISSTAPAAINANGGTFVFLAVA